MKKIILLLLVAFLSVTAHAQKSAADSTARVIELKQLSISYRHIVGDIEYAKDIRESIDAFQLGRSEEKKEEQQDANDKQQAQLAEIKKQLEQKLRDRVAAYQALYPDKKK